MTERIKELAKQSGISILYEYDGYDGHAAVANLADIEKFAELIVRECVAKTMEVGEQNDEPIEPIWVANCIAHRIFKHFGVEE